MQNKRTGEEEISDEEKRSQFFLWLNYASVICESVLIEYVYN